MSKTAFKDLSPREQKEFKQRQILIEEAIEKGSFDSRREVKAWMKDYFKLDIPLEEVSTEYSLTDKQKKLFYMWLLYFTGRGKRPHTHKATAKISDPQLKRIYELQDQLGWTLSGLLGFVAKQINKKKTVPALWKYEATKVITGMERILAEQPFKMKEK